MGTAAWVLVCALEMLGRSASQLPPIHLHDLRPPGVSIDADAFVDRRDGSIHLIASAPAFREALRALATASRCTPAQAVKMVASIIVHEEWHLTHGPDERAAYHAQLQTLQRLGVGPGRWWYYSVTRALEVTEAAAARGKGRAMASRR